MIPYLTENTVFGCTLSPVVSIWCREGSNTKVRYNGAKLLTTKASVQMAAGVCPILQAQGVPMCQCSLRSSWVVMKRNVFFKQSTPFLTANSFNICTYAGIIQVKASMNFKVGAGNNLGLSVVNWLHSINRGEYPVEDRKLFSRPPEAVVGKGVSFENIKEIPSIETEASVPAQTSMKDSKSVVTPRKEERPVPAPQHLLCPMDQGEKCKMCLYPKSLTEVHNDSVVLRKNYENKPESEKDDYDVYYESIFGCKAEPYWTDAAHHLISGNQVFKKHPEIVRLANFYTDKKNAGCEKYQGYDINGAANCIMLISKDREYRQKAGSIVEKNISAYDAMSTTGIQWHLGGHSYTFSKEEIPIFHQRIKIFTKKTVRELKNYAELVDTEMSKIELSMRRRKVCRDTPRQNAAFVMRMNTLSAKIKKFLAAFREKPHHSYPYYVSLEAFRYTFGLLRTGKIIVVKKGSNDEKIILEKYRVKRFEETIVNRKANLAFQQIFHRAFSCKMKIETGGFYDKTITKISLHFIFRIVLFGS